MESIYEELQALESNIQSFPPKAHWFCPKVDEDDNTNYEGFELGDENFEDSTFTAVKQRRVEDAQKRQDEAYQFIRVYGLPEDDQALAWRSWYSKRMNELLTTCDKCVKNYHMGRMAFLEQLALQYDEDTILQMSAIVDRLDIDRIEEGLKRADTILRHLPHNRRSLSGLGIEDPASLQALYEALCCQAYHTFKEHPSDLFDSVFSLIQTNKTLVLGDLVPATTRFLFSHQPHRLGFALKGWTGTKTNQYLSKDLFTWIVQDALIDAMRSMTKPAVSITEVERFWQGARSIIEKLDENLITHSLRALEVSPDIYHLALESLKYENVEVFELVLKTMYLLIQKSAKSLWDAYGSISPSVVAEQVFNSPAFKTLLRQNETSNASANPALSWIAPFIRSLGPNQRYEACRTMLTCLFGPLQDEKQTKLPQKSRYECCGAGLDALSMTLGTFTSKEYHISASTSFITINNVLKLVDRYKGVIVQCALADPKVPETQLLSVLGLDVIRLSIYLDCRAFRAQFQAIYIGEAVHQDGLKSHSESLWQTIMDSFRPDDMAMAADLLAGIAPLNSVDHFRPWKKDSRKNVIPLTGDEERFEKDFGPMSAMVTKIYQRLSEFKPENLRELCQNPKTAVQMFAGLTPADKGTYEMAVDIIKTVTGEETRKDAISNLLRNSMEPTLTAMYKAILSASTLKTYPAFPYIIKTGSDTLESLCDAQDGILRTRSDLTNKEQAAIKMWWRVQWSTLDIAFGTTERWSQSISSAIMTNFVRDTMDFAGALFESYSVIASALESLEDETSSSKVRKSLLEPPRRTMDEIAKWLRLRDPYLVNASTSLVSRLLRRLGEFEMEIDDSTAIFIGGTLDNTIKTVLTGQQKAELRRAFHEHFGIKEIEAPKQEKIKSRDGVIDLELWTKTATQSRQADFSEEASSLTKTLNENRIVLDQMKSRKPLLPQKTNKALKGESIKESREREKKARQARDAEAIAKAKILRGESALVAGEGSALAGLGNTGKDHAPQRGEIMVSSDSDSDSDQDDSSSAIIKKRITNRKSLDPRIPIQEGPVKKKKIIRSSKDMRARLTPPLEPLHQIILDWEIFHDGNSPPGVYCHMVANKFRTTADYSDTFMPLLVTEAWRSFKTAHEQMVDPKPFTIKVANRMSVDRFFEVSTSTPASIARDQTIRDGDIVLLSKAANPMTEHRAPHCLGRVARINRKKEVWEISYRVSGKVSDQKDLLASFAPNLTLYGVKVTSMTTVEREYAALYSLQYYDLCEEVLSAKPSPLLRYSDQDTQRMQARYELNGGQAKAVLSARDNDGFTLIQGPPGTGKTKTIVAMIGTLLTGTFGQDGGVTIARPPTNASQNPAQKPVPKKLLVCAPSNAAVDEIVMRIKAGIVTTSGEHRKINVVRTGRVEGINSNVKDVCLEAMVDTRMQSVDGKPVVSNREKLHQDAAKLKEEVSALRPRLDAARAGVDKALELRLQRDFEILKRQQAIIGSKIDEDKDNGNTVARDNDLNRRRIMQQIIDGSHVICATLSGSGHDMFKNLSVEFETVIIDEAAQSVELSSLIPLKYGCAKCILVGDPNQLPPTVMSKAAADFGYEQSLFVRMQKNHPESVHLLDTQYRMHPEISIFPSEHFYESKVIDGHGMANLRTQPWHANSLLGPYRFFDVKGAPTQNPRALVNLPEINLAMQLYERVQTDFPQIDFRRKFGIITPYRAQLAQLKATFSRRYGESILEDIDFNTTDSFQGREADIIIFSCVRAEPSKGIGFLTDLRRMNVGLTRAKSSLWVLGNSDTLMTGEFWAKLVLDVKDRQLFTTGDVTTMLRRPTTQNELNAFARREILPSTAAAKAAQAPNASPMEDVVYTSRHNVEGRTNPAPSIPADQMDAKEQERRVRSPPPQPLAAKSSKSMSLTDRMRKNAKPVPPIRKVAVERHEFGKRLGESTEESSTAENPAKRQLSSDIVDREANTSLQPLPTRRPGGSGPLNPALRAQAPKIIRKRPAADPLRRNQRR